MTDIKNMLQRQKEKLNHIEAPLEMEARLKQALENAPKRKILRKTWAPRVAIAMMALLFIGFQFDTLAYYGKRLLGYDQIMTGTLRELNELGSGQTIGKSYTFKNKVNVTLDGIMLDDNQMLVFYTVKDPRGKVGEIEFQHPMSLKGLFKEYRSYGGQGIINEEETELKNIFQFQPPLFLERKLTLSFSLGEGTQGEVGEIPFALDWNKAMGHTIKRPLNQVLEVDKNKIRLDFITASPTKTSIKGRIQSIWELAQDEIKGERMRPSHMVFQLLANGKEIPEQGSGMSTDMKGITFNQEFDALPRDLKKLQLKLVSFAADHDVQKQISLNVKKRDKDLEILDQKIVINKVSQEKGDTFIKITSEESVVLTRVGLILDNERVNLIETTSNQYEKSPDGTILHTRILHFPGTGSSPKLDIQRMTYEKSYHQTIDIPLD